MKVNPSIFRAYDIRGKYPGDFDAAFAQQLGARVAAHLHAEKVIVGRDVRQGSEELAHAVIDGVMHHGSSVIDIGEVTSPQLAWATRALGATAGIMVTASHNPGEYNGFKVVANRGETIDELDGHRLRQIYDSREGSHRRGGQLEHRNMVHEYADAVAYAADWRGGRALRLSVDAPHSVLKVLHRLGPVAPDDGLAVRFDMDGDRIAFFEHGTPIPADLVSLILIEHRKIQPVVFDLLFSRVVRERLTERGVPFQISGVGGPSIGMAMDAIGARFGAEMSGHFYWRQFGGIECPELMLLSVYDLIEESGTLLTQLIAPYQKYHKTDWNMPVHDRKHAQQLIEHIGRAFPATQKEHIDGLTIDAWDSGGWWLNIRPSNTEPFIRLTGEAKEKDLLDQKVAEIKGLLS